MGASATDRRDSARARAAIDGAFEERPLSDPELIGELLELPLFSDESSMLIGAARRLSEQACEGLAEVHAQTSLNVGPCVRNCMFCSFAECNGVFSEQKELPLEGVIRQCRQFEAAGANAIYLMATGIYPFRRFIERAATVREQLKAQTVMIANCGDFGVDDARELRRVGFEGVYHAVRLGEGQTTDIPIERRLATFRACREAGLALGTCLEPVGPEHTTEELVEKLVITRDAQPAYSGSARRVPISGTPLGELGAVSEARMAHILAVVRVVLPLSIPGNCTHEPNALGAAAGANLLWAEMGANPRDTHEKTEEGRGMTVAQCRAVLSEGEWEVFGGPSAFYRA